jgi:hypothetical protein
MGIGSAASDGDLVGIHHVMQLALFGVVDPSGQQAFIDAVRSGVDLNTIWDGWAAIPGAVAYGAALGRLVAVEGTVDHLAAAAPGADPAARQAALARLSLDAAAVVVDLVAAVNNAAPQAQVPPTGPTG